MTVACVEDESGEKLVSVQLDDEESWLNFIDVPGSEVCLRNSSIYPKVFKAPSIWQTLYYTVSPKKLNHLYVCNIFAFC